MPQNAGQQVEDLKMQLDDALGTEETIVQVIGHDLMFSKVTISTILPHAVSL